MTDLEDLSMEDLQALSKVVEKKYTKALKRYGGNPVAGDERQARWHRIGMKVCLAIARRK